jgi:hypothetical protein
MSELVPYDSERIYWAVEQVEQEAGDIEDLHLDDNLFYIKADADKKIDFWRKESHDHYERWFNLNKQYECWFGKVMRCERAERELRHQKYKRCLAMARWCASRRASWCFDPADEQLHKSEFYDKWKHRWLELVRLYHERTEI